MEQFCNRCIHSFVIVVDCSDLKDPEHGRVSVTETTYNSVATYTCNDSYTLVGDHERKCLSSGIWFGATPICTGKVLGETLFTLGAHAQRGLR